MSQGAEQGEWCIVNKPWARARTLSSSISFATAWLCDLEQGTYSFWALILIWRCWRSQIAATGDLWSARHFIWAVQSSRRLHLLLLPPLPGVQVPWKQHIEPVWPTVLEWCLNTVHDCQMNGGMKMRWHYQSRPLWKGKWGFLPPICYVRCVFETE